MSDDPQALLQQAQKTLASAKGGFSFFSSKTDKLESARDLYKQAASAFRRRNDFNEAALAFDKAAAVEKGDLKDPIDAANTLYEAAKMYKDAHNPERQASILTELVNHYTSKGDFRRATRFEEELAKIYKDSLNDPISAMEAFETTAQWFLSDGASALANRNYIEAANIAAVDTKPKQVPVPVSDRENDGPVVTQSASNAAREKVEVAESEPEPDYDRAIRNYEQVLKYCVTENSARFAIKEHLFTMSLCRLGIGNITDFDNALEDHLNKIQGIHPPFTQEREYKFLLDLRAIIEDIQSNPNKTETNSKEEWDACVNQFTRLSPLKGPQKTIIDRMRADLLVKPEVDYS